MGKVTYTGNPIRLRADISAKTLKARRKQQNIFKVRKGENLHPRLLYPTKISFKIDGEIKSFSDKQKLRESSTTKPSLGTYISIITLNVNELNAPTKRHRLAEQIQKQDSYICCLQETHFRPQDTYRLKERGWKNIWKAGAGILILNNIELKEDCKR